MKRRTIRTLLLSLRAIAQMFRMRERKEHYVWLNASTSLFQVKLGLAMSNESQNEQLDDMLDELEVPSWPPSGCKVIRQQDDISGDFVKRPSWLPPDWKVVLKTRLSGVSKGRVYKVYQAPNESIPRFRTQRQVLDEHEKKTAQAIHYYEMVVSEGLNKVLNLDAGDVDVLEALNKIFFDGEPVLDIDEHSRSLL